jgi:hypothetical protein
MAQGRGVSDEENKKEKLEEVATQVARMTETLRQAEMFRARASEALRGSLEQDKSEADLTLGSPEVYARLYRQFRRDAADAYTQLSSVWRIKIAEPETVVSQFVCFALFIVWFLMLPKIGIGSVALAGPAPSNLGFDPKPLIHLGIFVALFGTFVVSIWVHYFSDSEKAADQAGTVSKTLLGFFIGAATNYLGITTQ